MDSLYALSVNGTILYFIGEIPNQKCKEIDIITKEVEVDPLDMEYTNFCNEFIKRVKSVCNIQLKQMNIAYVFRK